MSIFHKLIYRYYASPIQISRKKFCRTWKPILKLMWKYKGTRIDNIPLKRNNMGLKLLFILTHIWIEKFFCFCLFFLNKLIHMMIPSQRAISNQTSKYLLNTTFSIIMINEVVFRVRWRSLSMLNTVSYSKKWNQ